MWTVGKTARIDVNMKTNEQGEVIDAGDNPVEILGSAATVTNWYGKFGTINLGLTTKDSKFTGNFYGAGSQNLWLRNGAIWNNVGTAYKPWSDESTITSDIASNVTWLHGGADKDHAGNIFHGSKEALTIDNIEGYTNIFMSHDMDYVCLLYTSPSPRD